MAIELNEDQRAAVDAACTQHFTIVNGGAGVGKTTVIKEIAERMAEAGEKIELCAFAGKAAARMREATGFTARTIHSMLGYNGKDFTRQSLKEFNIIIDEASMVPNWLLAQICHRNPRRLIMVGDEAQLPPVGIGQPFHDLLRLDAEAVHTLSICYRNSEAVYAAAQAIRRGECPLQTSQSENELYRTEWCRSAIEAQEKVLAMVKGGHLDFEYRHASQASGWKDEPGDIILIPRNEGEEASVAALNAAIVQIVNPHKDGEKFAPGDRVMCVKNHAELDIWNGTTATVKAVEDGGKRLYLETDLPCCVKGSELPATEVAIPKEIIKDLVLAYAITVHKAQGSQYRRCVFMPMTKDTFCLLNRQMAYTAVTRAKKECHIIGEQYAYKKAIAAMPEKHTAMQYIAAHQYEEA